MISLNYRDSRPIYEQIKSGLRHLMVTGALEEGEKLPSVRKLAADLAINPNTIQRAYTELENEGYVCTIAGKGSFAAKQPDSSQERREELFRQFDGVAIELMFWGVSAGDLTDRLAAIARKKGGALVDRS